MTDEYDTPVGVDDETTVVVAASHADCFHKPREDNPHLPACNMVEKQSNWKQKEYQYVKGWKRPCSKFWCYGVQR